MANHKKNKNRNGASAQAGGDNLSPAEKHRNWTSSKVERAGQDDYNVIQQKTKDTSSTVNFLNIIDGLMYYLRMNEGVEGSKVKVGTVAKYTGRLTAIKGDLNLLAAEICKDTGREYRPPRGYKNPLISEKPQQKAKKAPAKPAAKAADKNAGDASAKVTAGSPAASTGSSAALVIPPKAADAHSAPAMAASA